MTDLKPRDHQQLFGHQALLKRLKSSYDQGRLHHGLIFAGPEGVGKETLAYQLARYAVAYPTGNPKQEDFKIPEDHKVYKQFVAGSDPHLLVIEPVYDTKKQRFARDITLDALDDLSNFLRLAPTDDAPRFIFINPADSLNRNAQNALLKALEEPPAKTYFILITTQAGALLPTIRSRSMVIQFDGVDEKEFKKGVKYFAPEMSVEDMKSYDLLTNGSIGQAIQYDALGLLGEYGEFCKALAVWLDGDSTKAMRKAEDLAYNTDEAALDRVAQLWATRLAAFIKAKTAQTELKPVVDEEEDLFAVWNGTTPQILMARYDAAQALWREGEASYLDKKLVLLQIMGVLCGAEDKKIAIMA